MKHSSSFHINLLPLISFVILVVSASKAISQPTVPSAAAVDAAIRACSVSSIASTEVTGGLIALRGRILSGQGKIEEREIPSIIGSALSTDQAKKEIFIIIQDCIIRTVYGRSSAPREGSFTRMARWVSYPSDEMTRRASMPPLNCDCLVVADMKLNPRPDNTPAPQGSYIDLKNECSEPVAFFGMRDFEYRPPNHPLFIALPRREFIWEELRMNEIVRLDASGTYWIQMVTGRCPAGHQRTLSPTTPNQSNGFNVLPYPR